MSKLNQNEMLAPSIMPSLMAMSLPSGPAMDPLSMGPSALKLNDTGISPFGVETLPVHLPSTSAAKAETASSNSAATGAKNFMGNLLEKGFDNLIRSPYSVRHGVHHVVDAGPDAERRIALRVIGIVGPLPGVARVVIEQHRHFDAPLVIVN